MSVYDEAVKFHAWLSDWAKKSDYSLPILRQDNEHGAEAVILWEEGPYEWTSITMGASMFSGETGNYSLKAEYNLWDNVPFLAEAINHYSIGFYKLHDYN